MLDAAIRALAEIFSKPMRAILWKSIGLALILIVVAAIACWTLWEWLYNHDQFWGLISLVMLVYGVWTFFINFDKALEEARKNAKPKS